MYQTYIFLSLVTFVQGSSSPTHLLLTRAGPCNDLVNTTVTVSEFSLTMLKYDSLVSGVLNISQDLDDGWQIKATMQKCVDIRNIDTCDFFRAFSVVTDGCVDDVEMEKVHSLMFRFSSPKLGCPLQAGHYKIENYPLFTQDNYLAVYQSKISTSVFGYTLRLDGFSADRRKVFCMEAHLQLVYMRVHDWIKNDIQETTLGPNMGKSMAEEVERD